VGASLMLATLAWLSIVAIGRPFGLTVGLVNLAAAAVNLLLLGVAFGSIALAVGSATGTKAMAIGVTSGLALITFIVRTLAPSVPAIKPLRLLSPFFYYSGHKPLSNGFNGADVAVLAGIAVVAALVALVAFDRRDLAA
jgi:ABC-2 type transport system permease protein